MVTARDAEEDGDEVQELEEQYEEEDKDAKLDVPEAKYEKYTKKSRNEPKRTSKKEVK